MQDKGYNVNRLDTYFLRFIGKPQSGWIEIPSQFIGLELKLPKIDIQPYIAESSTIIKFQDNIDTKKTQNFDDDNTDSESKDNLLKNTPHKDFIQFHTTQENADKILGEVIHEESVTALEKQSNMNLPHFEIVLTKGHFLYALSHAKAAMKNITLIPGETHYFFLQEIAKVFHQDFNELQRIYNLRSPYNDGVILADTYSLPYHASPEFIIDYLITQSLKTHEDLSYKLLGHYNQEEWFKIIAKASIIQKEAANVAEMPIVSSVIDNRIAKNMPLQMDGSLNYGKFSHTRITPERIRNDTSEFNTYKYNGIPKTASGSVSIDAIKAAIYPTHTNYLYFMRNKNGLHDFTQTYQEHVKNIKRVKN
ncbi:endolytic transglycosylase MltG [Helicobacter didelphidarum]|nr:endolytic transglycosylase MltG [Helicobacter didelphidarum]